MNLSLNDILKRNERKLEREKERVEKELKVIDSSLKFDKDNNELQESELESRVEDTELTESNVSLRRSLLEYLGEVKNALANIRRKNYGKCERCGKEIGAERLNANPSAKYCFNCAEIIERSNEEA